MTNEQWFALATVFASGVFSLLVSIITNIASDSKEKKAFERLRKKEKIEETRKRYEEALALLSDARMISRKENNLSSFSDFKNRMTDELPRSTHRLALFAPHEVVKQLNEAIAETHRSLELFGTFLLSGQPKENRPKPIQKEYVKLMAIMSDHLEEMEKQI